MASTGHCHNILSPEFAEIGVGAAPGFATGGSYGATWTQNFGRAQGVASPGGPTAPSAACPYPSLTAADAPDISAAAPATGTDAGAGSTGTGTGTDASAVTVRPKIVRHGRRLSVSGVVSPEAPDVALTIRVRIGKRVVTRHVRTGRHGAFAAVVRLPRGTSRVLVEITTAGTVSSARPR
jgi:hypothetical protein